MKMIIINEGDKTLFICLNGNTLAMRYQDQRVINVTVGGRKQNYKQNERNYIQPRKILQ